MTTETSVSMCIQPLADQSPYPATKQHAVVNIQPNLVTCPSYPEKFIRDNVVAPFSLLFVVVVIYHQVPSPEPMRNAAHRYANVLLVICDCKNIIPDMIYESIILITEWLAYGIVCLTGL